MLVLWFGVFLSLLVVAAAGSMHRFFVTLDLCVKKTCVVCLAPFFLGKSNMCGTQCGEQ